MRRYSEEVKKYIEANVKGRATSELVKMVNSKFGLDFNENRMRAYKKNHKLRSGVSTGWPKGHASKQYPREIKKYIYSNYKGVGNKEMAERLNKIFGTAYTTKQLNAYYKNHKLNSGLTGRFKKGHVPANKGRKGYCPPGCEKGWFKKGRTPLNHKPVGSERKAVDGYILIKTAEPNVWKPKHKVIWEKEHGSIPKSHVLIFLDGDKENICLENLKLVTKAESLIMNREGLRSEEAEYTKTAALIAKVKAAGYEKRKQLEAEG